MGDAIHQRTIIPRNSIVPSLQTMSTASKSLYFINEIPSFCHLHLGSFYCPTLLCQKLIKTYVIFRYNYSRDECPRAGGRSRKCSSGGLCCFDGCRNACFNPEGQSLSSEIGSGSRKRFRRRHRRKRKNGKDSQVEEVDVYGTPGVINIAHSYQTLYAIF